MKFFLYIIIVSLSLTVNADEQYDKFFTESSLRIDFALSGNSISQSAAVMALSEEPLWAGPRRNLIDPFEYGGYLLYAFDNQTGTLIYSHGFNTLFEEWRTTDEARKETRSWINSIIMPYPKDTLTLVLLGRNRLTGVGDTLLVTQIDPASIFIDRSKKKSYPVENILLNGHPTGKIDLVFISEGYTADRKDSFYADARRFSDILFQTPPFDSIGDKFNIRAVFVESEEAETDFSGKGIFKNTAFNSGFYTFGTDRYLTTEDIKSVRDAVWNVPCDAVFILVDSEVYGGGGIYNFYAIGTAHNERTAKVFVHEFGHSFAGLADEYFSSAVAYDEAFYNPSIEPWEPNITTLINFDAKWKSMLSNDTPVPTPPEEPYNAQPGVFEGGGYVAKGVYRPMNHCMMRDYHPFCPVCSKAILDMAKYLTDN